MTLARFEVALFNKNRASSCVALTGLLDNLRSFPGAKAQWLHDSAPPGQRRCGTMITQKIYAFVCFLLPKQHNFKNACVGLDAERSNELECVSQRALSELCCHATFDTRHEPVFFALKDFDLVKPLSQLFAKPIRSFGDHDDLTMVS
jgi:hypothetical protein